LAKQHVGVLLSAISNDAVSQVQSAPRWYIFNRLYRVTRQGLPPEESKIRPKYILTSILLISIYMDKEEQFTLEMDIR